MSTMSYSFEDGQVYEFVDMQTHNKALAKLDAARARIAELEASEPIAVIGEMQREIERLKDARDKLLYLHFQGGEPVAIEMQREIDQLQDDKAALETLLAEWQEDYALEHKRAKKWRRKYKALVELAEPTE